MSKLDQAGSANVHSACEMRGGGGGGGEGRGGGRREGRGGGRREGGSPEWCFHTGGGGGCHCFSGAAITRAITSSQEAHIRGEGGEAGYLPQHTTGMKAKSDTLYTRYDGEGNSPS